MTYRSTPSFAVGGVASLDQLGAPTSVSDPTPTGWRCFHCNEHFRWWRAAWRHFGSPGSKKVPQCIARLLSAAERGLKALEQDLECTLESHCLLDDQLQPRRDTLDPDQAPYVAELETAIAAARAAIEAARGAK